MWQVILLFHKEDIVLLKLNQDFSLRHSKWYESYCKIHERLAVDPCSMFLPENTDFPQYILQNKSLK